MAYPEVEKETKMSIVVTKEGVTVYGNREAFLTLTRWMQWLAQSEPSEHYECHLSWHLTTGDSMTSKISSDRNIWTLFDKDTVNVFRKLSEKEPGFDLTFMVVEKKDLDEMAKYNRSQLLPDDWAKED